MPKSHPDPASRYFAPLQSLSIYVKCNYIQKLFVKFKPINLGGGRGFRAALICQPIKKHIKF